MPQPSKDTSTEDSQKHAPDEPINAGSKTALDSTAASAANGRWARLLAYIKAHRLVVVGVGVLLAGLVGALVFTDLKYTALGWLVETKADITVVDSRTNQPLLDAHVEVGGQLALTDKDGKASLQGVRAGKSNLVVTKKAYKTITRPQKLKFRANHLGSVPLESNGVSVVLLISDKISGLPVEGAEVGAGGVKSVSNEKGEVRLSLVPGKLTTEPAQVIKNGFLTSKLDITVMPNLPPQPVNLTPAGKVYFLSNRIGRIDLYQSNLDGSEASIIVSGTGQEDASTGILPNVSNPEQLAVVSSREGQRDKFGALKHDLFLFNAKDAQLTKIESGVNFSDRRAWVGNYLVYEHYQSDSGCAELKVYSLASRQATVLAASKGTSSCAQLTAAFKDSLLYSLTSPENQESQGLYTVEPAGQRKQKLDNTPASKVVRQVKDTLLYEYYNYAQPYPPYEIWKSLNLVSRKVSSLPNGPSVEHSRAYVDSPGGQASAFIDTRDGKSELFVSDVDGERKLTNLGSVNQFVQWYGDNYIVFSSTKSDENALYAVALAGGTPKKVTDFYVGNSRTYSGGYNPIY